MPGACHFPGVLTRLLLGLILPIATAWVRRQQRRILSAGVPLTMEQRRDARAVGVRHPERVRLLRVSSVPQLRFQRLNAVAVKLGLLSPMTAGLTAAYGIFIRTDVWGDRRLLVHELAHTAQYERFGGIKPFLQAYLREWLAHGYPFGSLETEAAASAREICG